MNIFKEVLYVVSVAGICFPISFPKFSHGFCVKSESKMRTFAFF